MRPPSIDQARVQVFTMGEAVYLAGVQEVIRTQRATTLEIMYRAQVDRVDSVIGPYLRVLI